MKIIENPQRQEWEELIKRPYIDNTPILDSVRVILNEVNQHGDEAVRSFINKFDKVEISSLEVTEEEMNKAQDLLSGSLKNAIKQAYRNIEMFHAQQLSKTDVIETMPGIQCWRKSIGIEKVGLYIPGGTAPLFSTVLMLGIPAKIAGCKEIILCTPCNSKGDIHPAILYTAQLIGIARIFKVGGAQAIAAMAYGTGSIPKVYKIFGPGNQFVTTAKQLVQMDGVAIDMPAGPSEVCVLADETANPAYVAADLLSQAEHGADSQVLLVSTSLNFINECLKYIETQAAGLPRQSMVIKALENSKAILLNDMENAIDLVNAYAAEHLILCIQDSDYISDKITNAGSVFIGHYSPESVGDYASGTNHTLPTNGFARAYSGVSVDSFVKKITYQKLTKEGLQSIGETVIEMAEAEGLQAHANAVSIRLQTN